MERAVHQARALLVHNFNDIVIERFNERIDLSRRGEAILDRSPRRYDSPLLKRCVVNQLEERVIEVGRYATSRTCGEQPSGVNEAIPECDVREEPRGRPWSVNRSGELLI
jgi:hypothetical protein